jgi:rubredoxin
MTQWRCPDPDCDFVYDDFDEDISFKMLDSEWTCPECGMPKWSFVRIRGT